jgi:hypothetical protein
MLCGHAGDVPFDFSRTGSINASCTRTKALARIFQLYHSRATQPFGAIDEKHHSIDFKIAKLLSEEGFPIRRNCMMNFPWDYHFHFWKHCIAAGMSELGTSKMSILKFGL